MINESERISTTPLRLREAMDIREKKQVDLVRATGIDKGSISNYLSGRYEPKQEAIYKLSLALDVSEMWLWGYDVPMERQQKRDFALPTNILPMPEIKKVPRLGTIACGKPILAEENIEDWDNVPMWVRADFTLKCKGDSMINARIFDGDIVCIHKQEAVDDGEIAAVLIGDEATLKRVHLFTDHIVLQPENPNYRPLSYWEEDMNDVRILGKATYFISAVK